MATEVPWLIGWLAALCGLLAGYLLSRRLHRPTLPHVSAPLPASAPAALTLPPQILAHMHEALAITDPQTQFIEVNPAFTRMTGYTAADVRGKQVDLLHSARYENDLLTHICGTLRHSGLWEGEVWLRRRDGTEFLCRLSCTALDPVDGDARYVFLFSDVTAQRKAESDLQALSSFDTLTGLPNRVLFFNRLRLAMEESEASRSILAVIVIDLDRFQLINDTLGHDVGDQLLRAIANRLEQSPIRAHTIARLGSDEFALIVDHLHAPEAAERAAQAIADGFSKPLEVAGGTQLFVTPSIGISLFPNDGNDSDTLLRNADHATSQAKRRGRQTIVRYQHDAESDQQHRLLLSSELHGAIDRDEMRLQFQPRMDLASGQFHAVEALLRWHNREMGEIPPERFIPLAEDLGEIGKIGSWVLAEACRTLRDWNAQDLRGIRMAVNVSSPQLLRADFPDLIVGLLHDNRLDGRCLELELTETVLMENADIAARQLARLAEQGISIAMDDFGTGYSSLGYLRRLPISMLKIDRVFVRDLPDRKDDRAITSAVVAMAQALDLRVVAEGVETPQQLDYLRSIGCDEVQGFLSARPMDADECRRFLAQHRAATASA